MLLLAVSSATTTPAQGLVRDINATAPGLGSDPQGLTASGGLVYFTADDGVHGREVWWTDGTYATLAADIRSGPAGSSPAIARAFLGGVLVIADDGVNGRELHWVVPGGDVLLEVNPGPLGTPFAAGVERDGEFFFGAWTPATGFELYVTDAVTVRLVREIVVGPGDSLAQYAGMIVVNDRVLFNATDPLHGMELWSSDGTAAGTVLVKDIVPGPTSGLGNGNSLVGDGTDAWFMAYEPATGNELWRTDGSAAGTLLVHDLVPGTGSSMPQPILVQDHRCYLRAQTPVTGTELFTSHASSSLVSLVKDLAPGSASAAITSLRAAGDLVFFATGSISSGTTSILRTDGTTAGTFPVRGPGPPLQATTILEAVGVGTRVLFQGVESATGNEPWLSDGTLAGTVRLFDLEPGTGSSEPMSFTVVGNRVVFAATGSAVGRELFGVPLAATRGCIVETLQPGCPGANGHRPTLAGVGIPRFGNSTFEVRMSRAPASAPAAALWSFAGAPGASACTLQVALPAMTMSTITSATGTARFPLPVPNTPSLLALQMFAQGIALDIGGGYLGLASLSNGLRIVVGDT